MKPQTRKRYIFLASVLLMVGGLSLACFLRVNFNIVTCDDAIVAD